ncbi:T9SS type A sorting domain-containing protein, partial [bacterium BMS3Abin03]|nr:T9SS type A sorting domain-containing protein [bacterium BMS3Abin03]
LGVTSANLKSQGIVAKEYALDYNFPNPFNSNTIIKYSIPNLSQVKLVVFNLLGEEIKTLVNDEKPAGMYEVTWNADNLPSGVYFYQLRVRDFVETKKMILLR